MMTTRPSFGMACPHAESVMVFLREIGLTVTVTPGAKGFIDDVAMLNGGLLVDPKARASGLLHEAGHLAIVPTQFRHYISGDMSSGMRRIFAELELMALEPDSRLSRAMIQASDPEATAWAWSAGKAIGIPDDLIIQDGDYGGEEAFLRLALSANSYLGINGLAHADFCLTRTNRYRNIPVYPELAFWLQP